MYCQKFHKLFRDIEPEPGAFVGAAGGAVNLVKLPEDFGQLIRGNAASGVVDADVQALAVCCSAVARAWR